MRLKITSEIRDEYANKIAPIFSDYSYTGNKTGIPEKLLNSADYKKAVKEFLKDLISNNVADGKGDMTIMFDANPDEGEKELDELVDLAKDFLIGIDLKRNKKNRLYPDITQVPMDDVNTYRDDLKRIMIANEMVKPKMSDQKWLKKWVSYLNKWDKKGINDFAKASTQKSGLPGLIEKSKNKKAVKKQNPSPINLRGLNDVLNTLAEGNNLRELTPQIYKALGSSKAKAGSPKVNQEETLHTSEATVEQD